MVKRLRKIPGKKSAGDYLREHRKRAAANADLFSKFRRPLDVQCAEARKYLRQTIRKNPQYKFVLDNFDMGEDDSTLVVVAILLQGALEGRLDFHEMLFYFHPDPARRKAAEKKAKAMSRGEIPFMRNQMQ